jgi:ribosomal protein S6
MQKDYEITCLVKPGKTDEDIQAVLKQNGAVVASSSDMGERELAYSIAKHTRAHYWSVIFSSAPDALSKIEKALRIKKDILRFLVISKLREAEKPAPKLKPEAAKSAEVKAEPKTEVEVETAQEVKKTVKKKAAEPKKVAEGAVVEEKVAPKKKAAKPKTKKEEFSSDELNKKLAELVKED